MTPGPTTYPVNEVFATFQGEGLNMGRAAFFIRLHGCPVHCPWCDSAGTWHKDWVPKDVARHTPAELAGMAKESYAPLVVITGGEPCIHDLDPLVLAIHARGLEVALETCGAFKLPAGVDCITVSPKVAALPTKAALYAADEWKIIVDAPDAVEAWAERLGSILDLPFREVAATRRVWLHPEWSRSSDPVILEAIADAVKTNPHLYRAGWQLHKNYKVDSLDSRSRPLVPLGGDPQKGC